MKSQQEVMNITEKKHEEFVCSFLTSVANRLLNMDVSLSTYSKVDGAVAHTIVGTKKIEINTQDKSFQALISFYESYQTALDKAEIIKKHHRVILTYLVTIIHELTHVLEGSAHKVSHGPNFKKMMFESMTQVSISGQNGYINILKEILDGGSQRPAKKQKQG